MSPTRRPALLYSHSSEDCQILSAWLSELGIPLIPVPDTRQTALAAQEGNCQFILMDLEDEPSWRVILRDLRRQAPATEVIVYTRHAEVAIWLDALEAGAFDLLCKPFDRSELARVVTGLRRQRARPAAA